MGLIFWDVIEDANVFLGKFVGLTCLVFLDGDVCMELKSARMELAEAVI